MFYNRGMSRYISVGKNLLSLNLESMSDDEFFLVEVFTRIIDKFLGRACLIQLISNECQRVKLI